MESALTTKCVSNKIVSSRIWLRDEERTFGEWRQTPPRGPRRGMAVSAAPKKAHDDFRGLTVGTAENGPRLSIQWRCSSSTALSTNSAAVPPPASSRGVSTRGWRWLVPQSHSAHSTSTPTEPFVRARLCFPLPYGLITNLSSSFPFYPSQTDMSREMRF